MAKAQMAQEENDWVVVARVGVCPIHHKACAARKTLAEIPSCVMGMWATLAAQWLRL